MNVRFGSAIIAAALLLAACSSGGGHSSPTTTNEAAPTTARCTTGYCPPPHQTVAREHQVVVAPSGGKAGTAISVRGEGCVDPNGERKEAILNLTTTDRQNGLDSRHVAVRSDGRWDGSLAVPTGTLPGDYLVNATCNIEGDIVVVEYESAPFRVTS